MFLFLISASLTEISLFGMRSNDTADEPILQYEDGQEVLFNEGEEFYFQCRAGGGSHPPAFQFNLGDEDITEMFTSEDSSEVGDGQPGLKRLM